MRKNFGLGMRREWKYDETPLTATDTAVNELVLESLRRDFPQVHVIGEEGNHEVHGAEYTVFCDPMDGTIPFCLGVPVSSFCISVVRGNVPLVGVIYDPFARRLWQAARGQGSFLNDESVSVSRHQSVFRSNICMVWWKDSPYNLHAACQKLMDAGAKWINPASIAYFGGLVASGEFEATIFPGRKAWETAAMHIIVEEAGGKVTDIHGNEMRYGANGEIEGHIVSNGVIHEELVAIVRDCQG